MLTIDQQEKKHTVISIYYWQMGIIVIENGTLKLKRFRSSFFFFYSKDRSGQVSYLRERVNFRANRLSKQGTLFWHWFHSSKWQYFKCHI